MSSTVAVECQSIDVSAGCCLHFQSCVVHFQSHSQFVGKVNACPALGHDLFAEAVVQWWETAIFQMPGNNQGGDSTRRCPLAAGRQPDLGSRFWG